jgi:hypothetical protein
MHGLALIRRPVNGAGSGWEGAKVSRGRFAAMMSDQAGPPLVFLDVDGPLIPFRARTTRRRQAFSDFPSPSSEAVGNPLVDRLEPADGRRLLGLGCQLVWATTWMAEANEVISPRLGLPELPVVDFPTPTTSPCVGCTGRRCS